MSVRESSWNLIGPSDILGQERALKTLLKTMSNIEPPGCIALYGSWGSGKSTILFNAMKRWKEQKKGPVVWFDPWKYERTKETIAALLHRIEQDVTFGKDKKKSVNISSSILDMTKTLAYFTTRSALAWLMHGESDAIIKSKSKNGSDPRLLQGFIDSISKMRSDFATIVDAAVSASGDKNQRLVIFLDDLDRCLPDTIVELIESIKLLLLGEGSATTLADIIGDNKNKLAPQVIFVFALDRQLVGEAVQARYPNSSLYSGENYLEKIFDISLEVPQVPLSQVRQYVTYVAQQIGGENPEDAVEQKFARSFATSKDFGREILYDVLSRPIFSNPRVIKRACHRLSLLHEDEYLRERISEFGNKARNRRFIAWIVGCERFRQFRNYYISASDMEIAILAESIVRQSPDSWTDTATSSNGIPKAIYALLNTPGFLAYMDLLFGNRDNADLPQEQRADEIKLTLFEQRKEDKDLKTIRALDDELRLSGL